MTSMITIMDVFKTKNMTKTCEPMLSLRFVLNFSINPPSFWDHFSCNLAVLMKDKRKGCMTEGANAMKWGGRERVKERKSPSVCLHVYMRVCEFCLLGSAMLQGCCARQRSCFWKGEESRGRKSKMGEDILQSFFSFLCSITLWEFLCCPQADLLLSFHLTLPRG